jgi:DNA-binding NarL/FixJ family response regulator
MLKILIVEDHSLVREGLAQTLIKLAEGAEVFQAPTCESACTLFEKGHDFDLVLLDLGLPGTDGMTCLSIMRKLFPAMPVVIVSAYDDAPTINRALKNGASGFVPKAYSCDQLTEALYQVLNGHIFIPERTMPARLGADLPPAKIQGSRETALAAEFGLTERKAEILSLIVRGKSNREIAAHIGTSEGTVKIHVTSIFKALGVNSRAQALLAVMKYKIIV